MHGSVPPRFPRDGRAHPIVKITDGRSAIARQVRLISADLEAEMRALGDVEMTSLVRDEIRSAALLVVKAKELVDRAGWGQSVDLDKMLRVKAAADRARDRLMKRAQVKR